MSKCINDCILLYFTNLYLDVKSKSEYKYVLRNFQDELRKIPNIDNSEFNESFNSYSLEMEIPTQLQSCCISIARDLFKNPILLFDGFKQTNKYNENMNTFNEIICKYSEQHDIKNNILCQEYNENKVIYDDEIQDCESVVVINNDDVNDTSNSIVDNNNDKISCVDNSCDIDKVINDLIDESQVTKNNTSNQYVNNSNNYDLLMSLKYNNKNTKSVKSHQSTLSNSSISKSKIYKQIQRKYMNAYK